jgi:hypothetical protein
MRVKTQLLVTILAVLVLGTGVAAADGGSGSVDGIISFLEMVIDFLQSLGELPSVDSLN